MTWLTSAEEYARVLLRGLSSTPGAAGVGRGAHGASSNGNAPYLGVLLGVGIPALVLTILLVVFLLVRGAMKRARAALEQEGIVLDSGPVWLTVHLSGFRGGGFALSGVRKTRVSVVLTRNRLVILPSPAPYRQLSREDLGCFTAAVAEDGALRLHSASPPRGSGSIDYRIPVADGARWVAALVDAGARPS